MRERVGDILLQKIKEKKPIMMRQAMREAGYSRSSSESGTRVKSVRDSSEVQSKIADYVAQMEQERQAVLRDMPEKRKKASYRDLVNANESFVKLQRLLVQDSAPVESLFDEERGDMILERIQRITIKKA